MKKLIFTIAIILLVHYSYSQNSISFSKVIQADSIGKTNLFIAVNDWFATNYNSAKDVIQMADKEAGIITGVGTFSYSFGKLSYLCFEGKLQYTIKIEVKDNRYRVELTNFAHSNNPGNSADCELGLITDAELYTTKGINKGPQNKTWSDIKIKAEQFAADIFTSIESKINSMSEKSDW